jgi:HEAT repeat protein
MKCHRAIAAVLWLAAAAAGGAGAFAQQAAPAVTREQVAAAVPKLGSFDYKERTESARTVRRAATDVAVPVLAQAARKHDDEYVRYRALTLLSGFGGQVAHETMTALRADRNDRIRTVVFAWLERNPDPAVLPALVAALDEEQSEFVRPALTRAVAAQLKDPRAQAALAPLVLKGADFFRGPVIEALGEYGGRFALGDIVSVAGLQGPLQDDAITALGRLGDESHIPVLARLQKSAPQTVQPTISAALCLLGRACEETVKYLKDTLSFATRNPQYQPLLRGAVHAHAMLALRGRTSALDDLLAAGAASQSDQQRSPIALGVGLIALKKPDIVLQAIESAKDPEAAAALMQDAFDMLAEDFEEEQFFVFVRRAYWAAPEGSPRRRAAELLIQRLEF